MFVALAKSGTALIWNTTESPKEMARSNERNFWRDTGVVNAETNAKKIFAIQTMQTNDKYL
jgi:hypothetical protein